MNRKIKMRDTFTTIFPSYNHGQPTIFKQHKPFYQTAFVYPRRNDDGKITHMVNREHTFKLDAMKEYHESMLKIVPLRTGEKVTT